MTNTKTRDSIVKMFFGSFGDMSRGLEDDNNRILTMSDLRAIDWKFISDSDKKELLIKSPERIKEILKQFFKKVGLKKTKGIDMPDELEVKYGPAKPGNPIFDQGQKMQEMEDERAKKMKEMKDTGGEGREISDD